MPIHDSVEKRMGWRARVPRVCKKQAKCKHDSVRDNTGNSPRCGTRIEVSKSRKTTARVYDRRRRESRTLVNDAMSAGKNIVTFDESDLLGGTNLLALDAGGLHQKRRMQVLQ